MHNIILIITLLFLTTSSFARDLWVDALNGDDNNDGLTQTSALQTLQAATTKAIVSSTIHIHPGVYRETVTPSYYATATAPITYQAESEEVILRGSISGATLQWQALQENNIGLPATTDLSHIIWADVSHLNLQKTPRFIIALDTGTQMKTPLTLAREPDWQVETTWKQHQFWWMAEGGTAAVICEPATDCDSNLRAYNQLVDHKNDDDTEAGNLTTLGDLTGATVYIMDAIQGHFMFQRYITEHLVNEGKITLDKDAYFKTKERPALGWSSRYYLENHPALLDSAGEYWLDKNNQRLYLWLPDNTDVNQLEIAYRDTAFDLTQSDYINLTGLTIEYFNETAIQQTQAHHQFDQLTIHHTNRGIISPTAINLTHSTLSHMDTDALYLENTDFATSSYINNNTFEYLGLRTTEDHHAGLTFQYANKVYLENNTIQHVAGDGVLFQYAIDDATDKTYGFEPSEIKTGEILIRNNLIENTCELIVDCGGLTFLGQLVGNKTFRVFRDVLILGNTIRNIKAWSATAEQRGQWISGAFGFGLYVNDSSGLHVYRNLIYDNSWANIFLFQHWRDDKVMIYNNLLAHADYGITAWNTSTLDERNTQGTEIVNNIFVDNGQYGLQHRANPEDNQFIIDHNLYYRNGWDTKYLLTTMKPLSQYGNHFLTVAEIQAQNVWEKQGIDGLPEFIFYDYEKNTDNAPLPDFRLTEKSAAINQGQGLAQSLKNLLSLFDIYDFVQRDAVWDIGAFEYTGHKTGLVVDIVTDKFQAKGTKAQFKTNLAQPLFLLEEDEVDITANVIIDPYDIGKDAKLAMVAVYKPQGEQYPYYFMRVGDMWEIWDKKLQSLKYVKSLTSLPKEVAVNIYTGNFIGLRGEFTLYVGYRLPQGLIIFNGQNPIQFTVEQ